MMPKKSSIFFLASVLYLACASASLAQEKADIKVGDTVYVNANYGGCVKATITLIKESEPVYKYAVRIEEGTYKGSETVYNIERLRECRAPSAPTTNQSGTSPSQSTGGNNQQQPQRQPQSQGGFGNPQITAQGNKGGAYPSDINGAWKGTYTCAQGLTNMVLSLLAKDETNVEGIMTFLVGDGPTLTVLGSGKYKGTYDSTTGRIELKGADWDEKPSGYYLWDLSGNVTKPGRFMSGRVLGTGCTTFQLEKIKF